MPFILCFYIEQFFPSIRGNLLLLVSSGSLKCITFIILYNCVQHIKDAVGVELRYRDYINVLFNYVALLLFFF